MTSLVGQIRRLRRILRRRGQRREDAEDLVQEAFLRLQQYCNEGHEGRSAGAFLTRTALNLAINANATARNVHVHEAVENVPLVDLSPSPDEVLAAEDCLKRVRALLGGLSPRTREIFFMHRLDGLSYAQMAEHFDISVSAIEKHIASAMTVLGQHMHEELKRQ